MTVLRNLLAVLFAVILLYTLVVIANDGPNFLTPFLHNLGTLAWTGQFALDFSGYLILSGLWLAWRGGFSGASIVTGIAAGTLGMIVFAPVVLILSRRADGDLRQVLLGVHVAPPLMR